MRFEHFNVLYYMFLLIPFAIFLFFAVKNRSKRIKLISRNPHVLDEILKNFSKSKRILKYFFLILFFIFSIFSLMMPQWGTEVSRVARKGVDVIICLDTSMSMNTRDVTPSRLERAKLVLSDLISNLKSGRIGIISFAGDAYVQCPLTVDRNAANIFLNILSVNSAPVPGTNIPSAIYKGIEIFRKRNSKYKVLILLTDGENLEGDVVKAAKEAKKEGIKIFTIGIGTPSGEPIPILDKSGNVISYKKDSSGNVVVSRLDERTLTEVANITGGKYFRITGGTFNISPLNKILDSMEKEEFEERQIIRHINRFQYPLLIAFFFLFLYVFTSERKNSLRELFEEIKGVVKR